MTDRIVLSPHAYEATLESDRPGPSHSRSLWAVLGALVLAGLLGYAIVQMSTALLADVLDAPPAHCPPASTP